MGKNFYLRSIENLISKEKSVAHLKEQVFNTIEFAEHISQTAAVLDVNPEIVRDVLESYWTNIFYLLNTVQRVNLKINVYGFFSLLYMKGKTLYKKPKKL